MKKNKKIILIVFLLAVVIGIAAFFIRREETGIKKRIKVSGILKRHTCGYLFGLQEK